MMFDSPFDLPRLPKVSSLDRFAYSAKIGIPADWFASSHLEDAPATQKSISGNGLSPVGYLGAENFVV
jgi:hypothetical protein